jgi:hypothetical protein
MGGRYGSWEDRVVSDDEPRGRTTTAVTGEPVVVPPKRIPVKGLAGL